MMKSQGIVRRIIEKNGEFLVSFAEHPAYFSVPETLRGKLRTAEKSGAEIVFTYDIHMNITGLS